MALSGFQSTSSLANQVISGKNSGFVTTSQLASQAAAAAASAAPPGSAQAPSNILTIGGFQLYGMEVPQRLTYLGGEQKVAIHDFPGGTRTIQSLGAFPAQLEWSGILVGTSAFSRSYELDRFRVAGDNIEVVYGPWKWSGVITYYHATVAHQWMISYDLVFMPDKDLSTPPVPQNVDNSTALLQTALAQISANVPVTVNGVAFPAALYQPLQAMQSLATQALLVSSGVVSAAPPSLVSQINENSIAAFSAGNAILTSGGTDQASLALASSTLHVLSLAGIVQNTFSAQPPTSTVLTTLNPNLYALAAQYLGDASRWNDIASVNNLSDPMPLGQYTLNIPTTTGLPAVPTGAFQ